MTDDDFDDDEIRGVVFRNPCGPCQRGQHGLCDRDNPYWGRCPCATCSRTPDGQEGTDD